MVSLSSHPNSVASVTLSPPSTSTSYIWYLYALPHFNAGIWSVSIKVLWKILSCSCKLLTWCFKAVLSAMWASDKVWRISELNGMLELKCFGKVLTASTGEWAPVKVWWENTATSHWETLLLTPEFDKMYPTCGTSVKTNPNQIALHSVQCDW